MARGSEGEGETEELPLPSRPLVLVASPSLHPSGFNAQSNVPPFFRVLGGVAEQVHEGLFESPGVGE